MMKAMPVTAAALPGRPFTYADLEDTPDDGLRYELSNGTLVVNPSPDVPHQRLSLRIASLLESLASRDFVVIPDVDVMLRPDTVKRPDVVVVAAGDHRRPLTATPVLVVEVLSPSTSYLDRGEKRLAYAEAGIPAYWIADPERRTLAVLRLVDDAYTDVAVIGRGEVVAVDEPFPVVVDGDALFGERSPE